jgi:hypothetical protein
MSTELAIRTTAPNSIESKLAYAQELANASMLPQAYRRQPANVLLAVELGEALGIPPIQAINGIHVIDGKPSASADLIASLVRRAGHKLRVTVNDAEQWALAVIVRADDPDFSYEARWDEAKARAAGLWGKGNWSKYPGQMLRNRAITEVARMGASDALYGVIYTPEELGADTNAHGDVVTVTQVEPSTPAAKPPTLQEAIAAKQIQEAHVSDELPPLIEARSEAQSKKLAIVLREMGMNDRAHALDYIADLIGHTIDSTKELTKGEASKVIDHLQSALDASADPQTGEILDAELVSE